MWSIKFSIPACIHRDCHKIAKGSVLPIQIDVRSALVKINVGLGIMMTPFFQVLPYTQNEQFKASVDATQEYEKFH